MTRIYLLLGGNLGNKEMIFSEVRTRLNNTVGEIILQSAVYETEPWGFESTDLFWNQVLEVETLLSAEKVLQQTQDIENVMGRVRKTNQYASRIIDIDILFYGDEIIQLPNLVIPHPRIQERKFTMEPLNEIAPEMKHPILRKTIRQLLTECIDPLRVQIVK